MANTWSPRPGAEDTTLRRLSAAGLVRLPLRELPEDFLTRPLPLCSASVVEALEQERNERAF